MPTRLDELLRTIHTLRAPGGCPWDHKQTLATAAHHLNDESAELLEAALTGDLEHVREELGDLLFMVCFVTEILSETLDTDFDRVAAHANEKLIRRHPHVFGDAAAASDAGESQERWNEIKAQEKRDRGLDPARESVLKDLPASADTLHQAHRYQKDAATVGFDWPDTAGVWEKIDEELGELLEAEAAGDADGSSTRSATSSSPSPTWPASTTSTPTSPCARRTRASASASTPSRPPSATTATASPPPPSPTSKPPGRRPRSEARRGSERPHVVSLTAARHGAARQPRRTS